MALSDPEKNRIIDMLEELDETVRIVVLASLDAFVTWLQQTAYSIYQKISSALQSLWEWVRSVLAD